MSSVEETAERLEKELNDLKNSVRRWRISAFIVCAAISLSGCGRNPNAAEKNPITAKIGKNCVVQFRRGDGLGVAAGNPVSPTTDIINGAEVRVEGKLESVGNGWVVLGQSEKELWIPQESILLIAFGK